MVSETVSRVLPYSREQVFDVAADIERYPQFLPGWVSAHIRVREGNTWQVEQSLGLGPLNARFTSRAVLQRPERIEVTSADAPFRSFRLAWIIAPGPGAACRVSIIAEIEMESFLLQRLVAGTLTRALGDIMSAFDVRVRQVCAAVGSPALLD